MGSSDKKQREGTVPRGLVTFCSHCDPKVLETLSLEGAFAKYASYRPIISSKEKLVRLAAQKDVNVTIARNPEGRIVGLAVLQYPEPAERWHRVGDRVMMEVSVIEVSRSWRSRGISTEMLKHLVNDPIKANRILYMVGYSWTWDLEGTGLSPISYRNMMIRLFSGQGFHTYQTNEPNIMMRPENLFMARIGGNISRSVIANFKLVRFGMDMV